MLINETKNNISSMDKSDEMGSECSMLESQNALR